MGNVWKQVQTKGSHFKNLRLRLASPLLASATIPCSPLNLRTRIRFLIAIIVHTPAFTGSDVTLLGKEGSIFWMTLGYEDAKMFLLAVGAIKK